MRVRILRDFSTAKRTCHAGEIVAINPELAREWFKDGRAMQDKSLDGARETKEIIGKNTRGGRHG